MSMRGSAAGARRLGEVLVEHGLITREQRRAALRKQKESGGRLGEILVREGMLSRDKLNWALGHLLGIPYVHPEAAAIAPELLAAAPLELLQRCQAVPMARVGDELTVAMADPTDGQAVADLHVVTGARIRPAMADPAAIHAVLDALSAREAPLRPALALDAGHEGPAHRELAADPSGLAILRHHLARALAFGADELLVGPARGRMLVRCRRLRRVVDSARYPAPLLPAVIGRLRLLAGIEDSGEPVSEGRLAATDAQRRAFDILVHLYAGSGGPAARLVCRPAAPAPRTLGSLGFGDDALAALRRAAAAPSGLVVACGPLGAGCSTTLHALLAAAPQGCHAVALERRSTHRSPRAVQLEAAEPAAYLAALGRLAQCPPDVLLAEGLHERDFWRVFPPACLASTLLLGEMRAADALSALGQLRELGLTGTLLASTLRLIVAQRRVPLRGLRASGEGGAELLFQVLEPDAAFRDLLAAGASAPRLREACHCRTTPKAPR